MRITSVRIDKGIHAVSFIRVLVGCILLQPLGLSTLGTCNAHGLCKDRPRHILEIATFAFDFYACLMVISSQHSQLYSIKPPPPPPPPQWDSGTDSCFQATVVWLTNGLRSPTYLSNRLL